MALDRGGRNAPLQRDEEAGAVFFETDGRVYPVNGIARGRTDGPEIDEIWADDPDFPGAKKHIGILIELGLELCE